MTRLRFQADQLRPLIAHAKAAKKHGKGWGDKGEAQPCLILVHDEGVYLMSNGNPGLMKPAPAKGHVVVYAEGLDPTARDRGQVWEDARDAVGGDDFAEYLPISMFDNPMAAGCPTITIDVSANQLAVGGLLPPKPKKPKKGGKR